jgi:hypothetical protein
VDVIDEIVGCERIGFACARAATSNVDTGDGSTRHDDCGRSGLPAPAGSLVVADVHAGDVGQRTMPKRISGRRHGSDRSEPPSGTVRSASAGQ